MSSAPIDLLNWPASTQEWIRWHELPAIGPGKAPGSPSPTTIIKTLEDELRAPPAAEEARDSFIAGVLLWLNHLDASHTISQRLASPEGSYWHGIMHRREPDYSNAKYWFRQVGPSHPVYQRTWEWSETNHSGTLQWASMHESWDASAMVDACQQAESADHPHHHALREIAAAEQLILLHHCLNQATERQA